MSIKRVLMYFFITIAVLILTCLIAFVVVYLNNKPEIDSTFVDLNPKLYNVPEKLIDGPWKTYIDPRGYFSISIPASWNVVYTPYPSGTDGPGDNGDACGYSYTTMSTTDFSSTTSAEEDDDPNNYYADFTVNDYINKDTCLDKNQKIRCTPDESLETETDVDSKNEYNYYDYSDYVGSVSNNQTLHPLGWKDIQAPQQYLDDNDKLINRIQNSFKVLKVIPFPQCK